MSENDNYVVMEAFEVEENRKLTRDREDIHHRFTHHPPNDVKAEEHARTREKIKQVAYHMVTFLPDCRERSLAITKLEEAMFWANAAIARNE